MVDMSFQTARFTGPQKFTYKHGFRQPIAEGMTQTASGGQEVPSYTPPPSVVKETSVMPNELGVFSDNTYPTLLNGTNTPQGPPKWFKKESEVDVLICGAGPSGLEIAVSLIRQGVSFRIIDKAEGPLLAGRADGVQPRFLETISQWGLATDVAEEGPIIERTAIWKDGHNLLFNRSHQSDSRYRGLHVITQTAIENIYLRDLLRHRKIVERLTSIESFTVDESEEISHPVSATLVNEKTGETENVRAKFLVGSDGGSSTIRKQLGIKFDGVATNIYWGIIDAVFETTYPHAGVFGCVVNSEHGGCCIIPREDGMIRLYTKIDPDRVVGKERLEEGGAMDIGTITADEVLAQANRIFAPFTLKFASPVSWFSIWKISERVAERFSYMNRVHLAGDACHVHSVMGAFGLNASILDSANLAWKMGLCARGLADTEKLMPTYEHERRRHAVRIIETSGTYLRFVCASNAPIVRLDGVGTEAREDEDDRPALPKEITEEADPGRRFLKEFFAKLGAFLLGVDFEYGHNLLNPPQQIRNDVSLSRVLPKPATEVAWGVRAPSPRVTLSQQKTGYLYDVCGGADKFTLLVFASNFQGPILRGLTALDAHLASSQSFYNRFGRSNMFKIVLITNLLPLDYEDHFAGNATGTLEYLRKIATLVWDDQLPGRDAHTVYGVDHAKGAVAVVRPDLWTGISVLPGEAEMLDEYFERFLTVPGKKS
ncbi:hypothetical protein SCP_0306370 [Sparassis crispa]|uniref:Uncharacterized protein n=1 Tax=Sparassis crispa TaxID=139825 RepID=A0A401GFK9_9APHY|nr:hypothetical protein SCP_0306370 [Sparassis crispa]GBE80915.1 hypothetical protein SCP_0306370 [Sparassis crispa]